MTSPANTASETGFTALFIRRPVMAFVLNTLIAVAGLAAFYGVEIRELPDVDRAVVTVSTTFEGAAAETVDRELTDTIEGAVARVSGVKSISSSSSFGSSRVTIEFNDGVDLNVAASDVRDAVGRVANQMPDTADPPRIVKADANSDPVMRLAVTSDNMSIQDMTVVVQDQIEDELAAVPGVADVQVYGDRDKIFRIDVDQNKLASLGFTVADLRAALASVAFDSPAGSITTTNQDLIVRTTADVTTPGEFENIIIGGTTRIRDVATVTLGPDVGQTTLRSDGKTGIGIGIIRQAESNTLDISTGVQSAVAKLQENLPKGMSIKITSDDAVFVKGAVHEVEIALGLSVTMVLIVIYVFLLDWRATLIPGLAMPVAMIGTIAAIYLAGFSVNILTLLALVLATGLVVDDAIVVLENIVRRRNEGMGPRAAAVLGAQEVFFAVIATTLTLVAVFVPISFLPGQTGGLFREFGFVLAMSVLLSCVVALTLCPMLASRMLTGASLHHEGGHGIGARIGGALNTAYKRSLHACLDAPWIVLLVAVLFAGTAFTLFGTIRQELTPTEDRAAVLLRISAPQGVSLDYTTQQMQKIERLIQPMRDSGEIRSTFENAGQNGSYNSGFMVMTLAPWNERSRSQQEIMAEISQLTRQVPSVRIFPVQPNSLGIRGAGNGLQFALVGNDRKALGDAAVKIIAEMQKDPRFQTPRLSIDPTQPQLAVAIDRERASDLGIDISGLANTLQAMLDGNDVVDVYIADRSYGVKLVSTTNPINDPTDLENIFLKTADGRFVPMSTIATLTERAVPPSLSREQQQPSVAITSNLSGDFALGDALTRAEQIATPLLPPGSRILPLAEAATLGETNSAMVTIFGFALVIILLVLAAQFESFVSAVIIMATVPLGLACAIFALLLSGTSLNAYSQIGLVLLVGVMAKNGILIVEFANQLRDRGLGVREAIEQASIIRVRPVMMTMICTVLGGLPLVLASGAGAEARVALGWVIVGGLGLATVSTLFLTPVAYLLLGRFVTPKTHEEARLKRELEEAAYTNVEPAE
ncbi:efflux RND transporter permease subunit [Mesorhizobium sp. M7A.F.Ca.CA.001.07.2.1]|uniref:efflux RND transporter permease subunit n=10 Tax=Phyllobacteriaceae TaxID=69277 RepID=UPI000FC9E52C|nr:MULTISPECIES: efflux RND transporter permease subunit [Mesorhizobium]MCF6124050.1 efflux RND transporter permease subunit [Mesorhizobium ciceri]MCQ8815049.1 efflux RND transporter permease subunit [Mesorhizobium sp. SEMIA396]RUX81726.1 efflux RND transporter permease subunit [Mesorhizobium sp. M7A.F.Ca.CA.004.08.2.1]RUX86588.1 efflux RND transporter permease subunit [Mesorhizobium sp. M7A.F.Ca.CA.004.08.1.1]RUY01683.1 efflux RND transporter permease subunit [Mesorhizobium sp. M7A.F.Ca.CA.00